MNESQSNRKRPAHFRAFLTTTAVVGIINGVFFLYFLSLPNDRSVLVMGGWGSWAVKGRVTPDWFAVVDIMNFPGSLIGRTCLRLIGLSLPNQAASVLFGQASGTLFWGLIAVIVEFVWTRRETEAIRPNQPT